MVVLSLMFITMQTDNLHGLLVEVGRSCGSFLFQRKTKKERGNRLKIGISYTTSCFKIPERFQMTSKCVLYCSSLDRFCEYNILISIHYSHFEYSVMPPGMWHSVYTPVGTQTSGGHFLMYDTMHQTYVARGYDTSKYPDEDIDGIRLRGDYSTNKSQSVDRQILRMVLALEYEAHSPGTFKLVLSLHIYLIFVLSGRIRRRPLMALMSMVRNVNNAGTTDYDREIRKSDILYREADGERELALSICKRILNKQKWTWKEIESELHEMADGGWSDTGDDIDIQFLRKDSRCTL